LNFGKRLVELREKANLSTAELARRAGIGRARLMRMEILEDANDVSWGNISAICRGLAVSIDALITDKVVASEINEDQLAVALASHNGRLLKRQMSKMTDIQVAKAMQFLYMLESGSQKPEAEKQKLFASFLKAIT